MILFDHMQPELLERSIIIDPYDPVNALVLIVTGLLLCLACLGLLLFSEVKQMNDQFLGKWFVRAANVAVFVTLSSLMFMYYPALDYWWFNTVGAPPFYTGLVDNLGFGYGRIHIVSVFLTMGIVMAAIISPAVVALMVKAFEKVVTQLRAGAARPVTKS